MLEIVWSAVVAAVVAGLTARYVVRRPRVHEYLNARYLQIWGPDGGVKADFMGWEGGAQIRFHGKNHRASLTGGSLTFSSRGDELGADIERIRLGVDRESAALQFDVVDGLGERIRLGVDRDGAAVLQFSQAERVRPADRDGAPAVQFLEPERIRFGVDRDDAVVLQFSGARDLDDMPTPPGTELKVTAAGQHEVRLGVGLRVKVIGPDGSPLWAWPKKP